MTEENQLIELVTEEGKTINCEVFDLIEYENKTYALLVPADADEQDEEEYILLEYVEEGDECTFVSIEDEEEFNRVWDYIESLADEVED